MWPDRVSDPGPLTYESGVLPTALRGPARGVIKSTSLRIIKSYIELCSCLGRGD